MGLEALRAATYSKLATVMNTTNPTVLVAYDNQKFEYPTEGEWVYVAIVPGERRRITLGNSPAFRLEGIFNIACMAAEDSGSATIMQVVDDIVSGMCDKEYTTTDGRVFTHSVRISNRGIVEGWYAMHAKIEFKYDEQAV